MFPWHLAYTKEGCDGASCGELVVVHPQFMRVDTWGSTVSVTWPAARLVSLLLMVKHNSSSAPRRGLAAMFVVTLVEFVLFPQNVLSLCPLVLEHLQLYFWKHHYTILWQHFTPSLQFQRVYLWNISQTRRECKHQMKGGVCPVSLLSKNQRGFSGMMLFPKHIVQSKPLEKVQLKC